MNDTIDNQSPDEEIELGSIVIDTGSDPTASVIWLHGLGADATDFEPLVPQLLLPANLPTRFILPDAPFRSITINGGYMMRGWYDIYEDISPEAPQDEDAILESVNIVNMLVEHELERGIPADRIVLAGFSQGGAVVLYAGLTATQQLGGILALSTYLPLMQHFEDNSEKQVPPIFMAHGEQDPVIPLEFAQRSKEKLAKLGAQIDWNTYQMPHSVHPEEVMAIREWLIERLSD